MISIKVEGDSVVITGSFNMGYMGVYSNDKISIYDSVEELRDWDIVTERVGTKDISDEQLSEILTNYFNDFERRIQNNIKSVNDNFLLNVFSFMEDCGYPFWEIDEITVKGKLPEDPDTNVYQPNWKKMSELTNIYYDTPNDGSVDKPDVEAYLRTAYPMFDMDKFIDSIVPEVIGLTEGYVSFQCSDNFGKKILCCAYDDLNENLTFTDWHNF